MSALSRRDFVKRSVLSTAVLPVGQMLGSLGAVAAAGAEDAPVRAGATEVKLRWLDGAPTQPAAGVTWGVPWPRGAVAATQTFALVN